MTFIGDINTGIGRSGTDQLSIIAGGKEIARAAEATTEQFIINPQGDLTGTAAAPSLAFGDGNTGFYENVDNNLIYSNNGNGVMRLTGLILGGTSNSDLALLYTETATATNPNIVPVFNYQGTGLGSSGANELSLIANSIEGVRVTEDTTFVKNYLKAEGGSNIPNVVQVAKATILYTNTTQTTIVNLPDGALISDINLNLITGFNGSGTNLLDVGVTGTANKYINDHAIGTGNEAVYSLNLDNQMTYANMPDVTNGSTNITFQYIDGNSDATAGEAIIYIYYTIF